MAQVMIPGAPRAVAGRPAPVGPGHSRKVGLIGGSAGSLRSAPWSDPSWEFWSHSSVVGSIPNLRADRLFDIHPKNIFTMERKNGFVNYYQFLQRCQTPVYMQQQYEAIPASVKYPLDQVQEQWPGVPLGSTTAFMIALALLEGVTHLGLWGIDYQHSSEYEEQRPNAELWVGIAMGLGVQVIIPKVSPLCHEPKLMYGYESHTPELFAKRIAKFAAIKKAAQPPKIGFDSKRLVPCDDQAGLDEAARIIAIKDPAWCREAAKMMDVEPAWLGPPIGIKQV